MTKNKWLIVASALGLALAGSFGGSASAKAGDDSVLGVVNDGGDSFVIDATASHNGTHAGGTVYGQEGDLSAGGVYTLERVICLEVEGNRATVGTLILQTNIASVPAGTYQEYSLIDNSAAGTPDLVGGGWLNQTPPVCGIDHSDPPAGYVPVTGDVTITDN